MSRRPSSNSTPTPPSPIVPPAPPTNTTDARTLLLIRRTLCGHAAPTVPLDQLLPALTSSSNVDTQLYAIIAVLLRSYILSWYRPLTDDHELILEILSLIAHITRSLEERLRRVDLDGLLFNDIPLLLDAHITDFRTARDRVDTVLARELTLVQMFKNYNPHPAFEGGEGRNERLYTKMLATGVLSVLLPTEHLESNCERTLLVEILSSAIIFNALDRLSEPAVLYEMLATVLAPLASPSPSPSPSQSPSPSPPSPAPETKPPLRPPQTQFWRTAEYMYAITTLISTVLASLLSALTTLLLHHHHPPSPTTARRRNPRKTTWVSTALPGLVSTALNLSTLHPWLPPILQLLSLPFASRQTRAGVLMDDLISYYLSPYLFNAPTVESLLRGIRASFLPGDSLPATPSPPPPQPLTTEQAQKLAEDAILRLLPARLARVWFDVDGEGVRAGVRREWLEVWGEKEVNKHALVRVLDHVTGVVFPELLEKTGSEIFEERVGRGLRERSDGRVYGGDREDVWVDAVDGMEGGGGGGGKEKGEGKGKEKEA